MKRHFLIIGLVAVTMAAAAAIIGRRAPLAAQAPADLKRPSRAIRNPQLLGAQTCATAVCHGGSDVGQSASAFTTWLSLDPHSRAYETLLSARSQAIAKNMWADKAVAQEAPLCLKCHVDPSYERARPSFRRADGVGCESCHGAAEGWLQEHYRGGGNRNGMADTKTLPGRARACVGCHVGTPESNVDHDLIAAGHPVLRFEFATYYANLPPHWDIKKSKVGDPRDFEARAWATGQLVAASSAMELLAHRADPVTGKTWPEFAEFDCFACHHDLQPSSWRQKKRPPRFARPPAIGTRRCCLTLSMPAMPRIWPSFGLNPRRATSSLPPPNAWPHSCIRPPKSRWPRMCSIHFDRVPVSIEAGTKRRNAISRCCRYNRWTRTISMMLIPTGNK